MSEGHSAGARAAARARWPAWLGAGALLAGAPALAFVARRLVAPGEPVCALRRATGWACPTCGLTRAFDLLARGAWGESLSVHPWAMLLIAQGLAAGVLWAAWAAGRLSARPDRWIPRVVLANLAALLAFWLARVWMGTLPA